ncbi:MAG: MerR family transcriptional regulator [Chloroflexota bacterium]|nr:MAG: MerR family transcriptional regulator [Chloroflexota bacterium]
MTAEFTPQQVAALVSIADRTLRHWSTRFSDYLSEDARNSATEHGNSHRKYTAQDVEVLQKVKALSEQRMRLSEIDDILAGRKTPPDGPASVPGRPGGQFGRASAEQQGAEPEVVRAMSSAIEENRRILTEFQEQFARTISKLTERLDALEVRLTAVEERTEERLTYLEKRTDERLASLDRRLIERIYSIEEELRNRDGGEVQLAESPTLDGEAQITRGGWLGLLKKRMPVRGRPSPLSRNLIRLMASRRWGRNDLALYSHVRVETITRILSGELTEPKPQTLEALAQALGTSPEVLVDGHFDETATGRAR